MFVLSCGDVENVRRWRWTFLALGESLAGHSVSSRHNRVIIYDAKGVLLPLLHLLSYRAQFERVCHSFQIEKHILPQLLGGCVPVSDRLDQARLRGFGAYCRTVGVFGSRNITRPAGLVEIHGC